MQKVIQRGSKKYAIDKYQYKAFEHDSHVPEMQIAPVSHEPTPMPEVQPQIVEQTQPISSQADTLLQKIDELSTSLVKMEMQFERQQGDFEKRLAEEKQRSYDEGAAAAKQSADEAYEKTIADNAALLASSVQKFEETTQKFGNKMSELEADLAQTAVSIAQQVIKKEVSAHSAQIAAALAQELLTSLHDAAHVTVKVNKEDYPFVVKSLEENATVLVQEDDAVQKGGVVILSDVGNLDARISSRFAKIRDDLLGGHEND